MRTYYVKAKVCIDGTTYKVDGYVDSTSRRNLLRRMGYLKKPQGFSHIKYVGPKTIHEAGQRKYD